LQQKIPFRPALVTQYVSGCKADTGFFNHKGGNGITSWRWSFGINASTTEQNPEYTFPSFGPQSVTLLVSNGTCSDSAKVTLYLDSKLKANLLPRTRYAPLMLLYSKTPAVVRY
jgi:hypothetical protein